MFSTARTASDDASWELSHSIIAGQQPGRLACRIDAAHLCRDGGEARNAQDCHSHERGDSERGLGGGGARISALDRAVPRWRAMPEHRGWPDHTFVFNARLIGGP
jgi:hypothetical protein